MKNERYDYLCKAGLIISFISHFSFFDFFEVNIFSLILGEYFFVPVRVALIGNGDAVGSTEGTVGGLLLVLLLLFLLLVSCLEVVGIKIKSFVVSSPVVFL